MNAELIIVGLSCAAIFVAGILIGMIVERFRWSDAILKFKRGVKE